MDIADLLALLNESYHVPSCEHAIIYLVPGVLMMAKHKSMLSFGMRNSLLVYKACLTMPEIWAADPNGYIRALLGLSRDPVASAWSIVCARESLNVGLPRAILSPLRNHIIALGYLREYAHRLLLT
jgi:hypothetical protein